MSATAATLTPLLAGTQCTLCGYPSCAAYAEALSTTETNLTLCVPGGPRVASALAEALNLPTQNAKRETQNAPPKVAYVQESDCIGCTLCLQKCPTSAIVGAPKQLHTILTNLCDGCNLCVPVCPTACITLQSAPPKHALTQQLPDGSLTESASQKIWSLVQATHARQQAAQARPSSVAPLTLQPFNPSTLSPELLALTTAARAKSAEKFAAKGPIRTPRALKPKT